MNKISKILLILVIIVILYTISQRFNTNPKVWYKPLAKNKPSKTIFPFGIVINDSAPDKMTIENGMLFFGKDTILKHEMTHWDQARKNGFLLFKIKNIYYNNKYGYFNNPFEKEAYIAADQWKYIPDSLKNDYNFDADNYNL